MLLWVRCLSQNIVGQEGEIHNSMSECIGVYDDVLYNMRALSGKCITVPSGPLKGSYSREAGIVIFLSSFLLYLWGNMIRCRQDWMILAKNLHLSRERLAEINYKP